MLQIELHDYRKLMRKRINRNPQLSLDVIAQLKAEDYFGFGVTMMELNNRLSAISRGCVLPPPPREVRV